MSRRRSPNRPRWTFRSGFPSVRDVKREIAAKGHRAVRVKRLRKGWQVESGQRKRKKKLFRNKRSAMRAARTAALRAHTVLIVQQTGHDSRTVVPRKARHFQHAA